MSFVNIAAGTSVFVDANTFVYHFANDPTLGVPCGELLQRIERQEILGYTSAHVLSETSHRLMTLEAVIAFGWSFTGIAGKLRRHPTDVQRLSQFRRAIEFIRSSKCAVLSVTDALVEAATVVSQATGLLSNDALVVAVMQQHAISQLASHDADFDRVPGITRFAPV